MRATLLKYFLGHSRENTETPLFAILDTCEPSLERLELQPCYRFDLRFPVGLGPFNFLKPELSSCPCVPRTAVHDDGKLR